VDIRLRKQTLWGTAMALRGRTASNAENGWFTRDEEKVIVSHTIALAGHG
jgi:hypothetical protein